MEFTKGRQAIGYLKGYIFPSIIQPVLAQHSRSSRPQKTVAIFRPKRRVDSRLPAFKFYKSISESSAPRILASISADLASHGARRSISHRDRAKQLLGMPFIALRWHGAFAIKSDLGRDFCSKNRGIVARLIDIDGDDLQSCRCMRFLCSSFHEGKGLLCRGHTKMPRNRHTRLYLPIL